MALGVGRIATRGWLDFNRAFVSAARMFEGTEEETAELRGAVLELARVTPMTAVRATEMLGWVANGGTSTKRAIALVRRRMEAFA